MRQGRRTATIIFGLMAGISAGCTAPGPPPVTRAGAPPVAPDTPVTFEPNVGQTDPDVRFVSRGRGYGLFLTAGGEAVLGLDGADVRMRPVGGDPGATVSGIDRLQATGNHLTGADPTRWRTGVPQFAKVGYQGVYPGVDLVFYGRGRHLEYDFLVAPGADPSVIRLAFEGADVTIGPGGDLVLDAGATQVVQRRPRLFQGDDVVDGRFVPLGDHEVGFEVGAYDPARPLVIDPVIEWSAYLGGGDMDRGYDVALDAAGNVYVTGGTRSLGFPVRDAVQPANRGLEDVFVTKLDPSGSTILYSTYLGGDIIDVGFDIGVDPAGRATVVGMTTSADFPTVRPVQAALAGSFDAFVATLDASGSTLVFSTYLGGPGYDAVMGGGVDPSGKAHVTGRTSDPGFPTTPGSLQPGYGGGSTDAFVAKVDYLAGSLVYATYLGGAGWDDAAAVAVGPTGDAYVVGSTQGLPVIPPGGFQSGVAGGRDAYVARVTPTGTALVALSYLGGSGDEEAGGVTVDGSGNVLVAGRTTSQNFPAVRALHGFRGVTDAFVAKLSPTLAGAVYSTFLGGSEQDSASDVAADASGRAYVTGITTSADFPTAAAPQPAYGGALPPLPPHDFPIEGDAFVTAIEAAGGALAYSTYLGGNVLDQGAGIAVDGAGSAVVTGNTDSPNFPTVRPLQTDDPQSSAFVTRLGPPGAPAAAVAGSTWFSDGTTSKAGPAGTTVRAFATGAFADVPYRLVTARPDPANPARRCAVDPAPVNDSVRFANGSGLIPTTVGVVNRPPGEWDLCFRSLDGQTVTAPIRFTVLP